MLMYIRISRFWGLAFLLSLFGSQLIFSTQLHAAAESLSLVTPVGIKEVPPGGITFQSPNEIWIGTTGIKYKLINKDEILNVGGSSGYIYKDSPRWAVFGYVDPTTKEVTNKPFLESGSQTNYLCSDFIILNTKNASDVGNIGLVTSTPKEVGGVQNAECTVFDQTNDTPKKVLEPEDFFTDFNQLVSAFSLITWQDKESILSEITTTDIKPVVTFDNGDRINDWSKTADISIVGLTSTSAYPIDGDIKNYTFWTTQSCINAGGNGILTGAGDGYAFLAVHSSKKYAYVLDKLAGNKRLSGGWPNTASEISCLWGDKLDANPLRASQYLSNTLQNLSNAPSSLLKGVLFLSNEYRSVYQPGESPIENPNPIIEDPGINCRSKSGPLGWIFCAIIETTESLIGTIYPAIQENFKVFNNTYTIDDDDSETPDTVDSLQDNFQVKQIWSGFRTIARSLLGVMLLYIIIQQVLGIGSAEAYTIKKAVPRLALAVIGIEVSWIMFSYVGELIEDIGDSIPALVYAPFGGNIGNIWVGGGSPGGDLLFTGGLFAFFLSAGVFAVIVPLALTVLVAVLLAFLTLVIRKIVLLILLVMAPLAFIAWILPNTESIFKKWWSIFSKTLLMYPLVMLLIAMGAVAAKLMVDTTENDTLSKAISNFAAVLAFFGPYFLIPFTFKFAGGALANLSGVINNKSKGIVQGPKAALQKRREDQRAQSRQIKRMGQLDRWNRTPDENKFKKAILGRRLNLPRGGITRASRERARTAGAMAGAKASMEAETGKAFELKRRVSALGIDGYKTANTLLESTLRDPSKHISERSAALKMLGERGEGDVIRSFAGKPVIPDLPGPLAPGATPVEAAEHAKAVTKYAEAVARAPVDRASHTAEKALRDDMLTENYAAVAASAPDIFKPLTGIITSDPEALGKADASTHKAIIDAFGTPDPLADGKIVDPEEYARSFAAMVALGKGYSRKTVIDTITRLRKSPAFAGIDPMERIRLNNTLKANRFDTV